ncbi:glycosyltransferase family 2 protein [Xylanimonas cellulosilytica]|uniref:glycosyltransferase family 2 protein n=1 Tax=Xylanimonas cellulosilytica TaxID=186189 RepID=UPI001650F5C5|nr:glycosyltransferase family 2 protein [Xylanimonas cellulosilytica]
MSVIVPFYNRGDDLTDTLDGLSSLVYPNLQVILVDDGSTDNGPDLAGDFVGKFPMAVLIANGLNRGAGASRNHGLTFATGDYVWFADSDDEWSPSILLELASVARRHEADVVICQGMRVDQYGSHRGIVEPFDRGGTLSGSEIRTALLDGKVRGYLWNKLIRRAIIPDNPFPEIDTLEDFCGLIGILSHANSVVQVNRVLYRYIYRADSLTSSTERHLSDFDLLRDVMRTAALEEFRDDSRSLSSLHFDYANWHLLKVRTAVAAFSPSRARTAVRSIASQMRFRHLLRISIPYPWIAIEGVFVKILGGAYPGIWRTARRTRSRVVVLVRRRRR